MSVGAGSVEPTTIAAAPTVSITGGEAVARALAAHGVDCVFGIPGTHNLAIHAHLPRYGIRHVTCRHEQGAGYAADGYARVTGRPGVVVTTSGPALLNAAAAAGQAYSDSVPVLFVSPGMRSDHPRLAMGELHETRDQTRAFEGVVARSHRVRSVREIDPAVALAFDTLCHGRPRPVHIEVPLDLLETRGDASARAVRCPQAGLPLPDEASLDRAAGLLAAARLPAVVLGGGARRAGAEYAEIAALLDAAVVTTANGKGVVAESDARSLGVGLHLTCVQEWLAGCDVVLAVGTELATSDFWVEPPLVGGQLIRVDVDPAQMVKAQQADVALVGDAAATGRALLERLRPDAVPGRRASADLSSIRTQRTEEAGMLGRPWSAWIGVLRDVLPAGSVLTSDTCMACYNGALASLPIGTSERFLHPTGFGTLGYALPAAVGALCADPDRPVIALSGDGGLQFSIQELATAVALDRRLVVVVFDNGGYGEIRAEMIARGDPPANVDLRTPDLRLLARAYGARGVEAGSPTELHAALVAALDTQSVTIIQVQERSQ